ncbi:unnamed protein product [Ceutorhynchus assimilis]|uniref:WD repeat-containing protein 55 homolog n=1 Tax=Ceutorhynchus assimilis TaxID=467358 RepID=A0A9P0GLU5_9CUCU|nr:unnamed protein product [Ceutorhynchus assimilis]
MCKKSENNLSKSETDSEDSMSEDSSVSVSEDSDPEFEPDDTIQEPGTSSQEAQYSDSEEDEVIKAIKRESEKTNNHPPIIRCEDFVMDICFHPFSNILAVATISGDVCFYNYSMEENNLQTSLELHTKSCRDIEFSHDGKTLFSTAKDKAIMLSDVESCKLNQFYENSHEVPVSCLTVLDEYLFCTGDDDGTIKLWDIRLPTAIYRCKKNEDYISDIITNDAQKYLICSSGDGSLTTIDLEKRSVFMQSEEYEEELTCLGLFRTETKLLAGSSKGKLYFFNWNEFGLHSDAFPGPKCQINSMIPVTENIVVTACEDGVLRAAHLFPHRHLGIVGQHNMSVEHLDICNDGTFIASSGHENEIKFWNIQYFENFEKVDRKHKKHERKKELAHNLPSSKAGNTADFFSDLA